MSSCLDFIMFIIGFLATNFVSLFIADKVIWVDSWLIDTYGLGN